MLIITGTFEVAPEDRDAFLRGREEGMRTSRAEQGCLAYVFAADPLEPGRVILFEQWETEEDLAAHAAAMQAARAAAPPKPADAPPSPKVRSSSITKHVVATSGPLF
jgi:quinol monooxygenase YgiN